MYLPPPEPDCIPFVGQGFTIVSLQSSLVAPQSRRWRGMEPLDPLVQLWEVSLGEPVCGMDTLPAKFWQL